MLSGEDANPPTQEQHNNAVNPLESYPSRHSGGYHKPANPQGNYPYAAPQGGYHNPANYPGNYPNPPPPGGFHSPRYPPGNYFYPPPQGGYPNPSSYQGSQPINSQPGETQVSQHQLRELASPVPLPDLRDVIIKPKASEE